jgi:predicted CXXCH cytochrome family protein
MDESMLCFGCHEFDRQLQERPLQHKPFSNGNCGACHDPHATSNRWVLIKASESVCFQCHDPDKQPLKNHIHPYNVKPKNASKMDLQLSKSGKLECLTCHNPHSSYSEHLLRGNQKITCYGWHKDM